jgi:hypothetical protein
MNTNSVCVFPDTIPRVEILFPLVQVFAPLVYLRPVENDPPLDQDLSPLCREMVDRGLVRFDCPAPLDDNRDRFLQLVHDLQHRRDDYAGQLSNLSLAGLGRTGNRESKTSIIGTLLKQTGIRDRQDEQEAMILWQARLVLKLAEIFDREQQDLQQSLERISERQNGLLDELREEDEQPFSLTRTLMRTEGHTDGQLRQRLKAWSRLFALGSRQMTHCAFITTSQDAFDLLLEQYELDKDSQPQHIVNLQLPGGRQTDTAIEQRAAFLRDVADLVVLLQDMLKMALSADEKNHAALEGTESKWARLLEQHYPADKNGRCVLSLYALPGVAPENFFLETFGRDQDGVRKKTGNSQKTGIIIGMLAERNQSRG